MARKSRHGMEKIATISKDLTDLRYVVTNADNTEAITVHGGEGGRETRVTFRGQTVLACSSIAHIQFALSPNGNLLAVSRGWPGDEIKVFGHDGLNHAYTTPPDFHIHHLVWLPGGRLVWDGFDETEIIEHDTSEGSHTILRSNKSTWRCFANGAEVTGKINFMPMHGHNGRSFLTVQEDGLRYVVRDDGTRHGVREACCQSLICHCNLEERLNRTRPQAAKKVLSSNGVRIAFNGHVGPRFDGLVEELTGDIAYNEARTRTAYVGWKRTVFADRLAWIGFQTFGKMGYRILDNPITAIPATLLFNPYFGPLYYYFETSSKRYRVVNHDRVWKQAWRHPPTSCFFTPLDELVAVCQEGSGKKVVIDEMPGPAFDWIGNVRYLEHEGRVCYAARRNNAIYRVTVR